MNTVGFFVNMFLGIQAEENTSSLNFAFSDNQSISHIEKNIEKLSKEFDYVGFLHCQVLILMHDALLCFTGSQNKNHQFYFKSAVKV